MIDRRNVLVGGGAALAVAAVAGWSVSRKMGTMANYNSALAELRRPLPQAPSTEDLIRFASISPSGHNTQPWRFMTSENSIQILPDLARSTPAVDPDDHHLFVSFGCAAETLAIAAASRGMAGEVFFDPQSGGKLQFDYAQTETSNLDLSDAIAQRQSTRSIYDGSSVSSRELAILASAAKVTGVDVIIITDRPKIGRFAQLVEAGNSAQIADPAFVHELKSWLRFNPNAALQTGDGLFSATSGNPSMPDWLGPTMFDMAFTEQSENKKNAEKIASSSGIAVFVSAKDDAEHWVLAGRACQRFSLQATALGLKHAYINQPVEVVDLRAELADIVGLPGRRPDIVMRFGRAETMPFSARRPVGAVMV